MGKLTAINKRSTFNSLLNADSPLVSHKLVVFILETGQIYTHGTFINGAVYGTETSEYIQLSIGGATKNLSLSGHTHSNYLLKNADIDIGTYRIVSGEKRLLLYASGVKVGDSTAPLTLVGSTDVTILKGDNFYTALDTDNFYIVDAYSSGNLLLFSNNVKTFVYGNNKASIYYPALINSTTSNFDSLAQYTCMGTTKASLKTYGFITMYTDRLSSNPTYALLRINTSDHLLEFRDGNSSSTWRTVVTTLDLNALDKAGIVAAPTSSDTNKVWATNSSGNPAWRDAAPNATVATNLSGGAAGSIPYQTAANTTAFLSGGSDGQILAYNGSTNKPYWKSESADIITASLTSVNLTSSWNSVDNLTTRLTKGDGSYLIQITYASCLYTGTFSYVSGGTEEDEIVLHCSGTVDSVGGTSRGRLYAKVGNASSSTYLKLAASQNESNATITIKYKKII